MQLKVILGARLEAAVLNRGPPPKVSAAYEEEDVSTTASGRSYQEDGVPTTASDRSDHEDGNIPTTAPGASESAASFRDLRMMWEFGVSSGPPRRPVSRARCLIAMWDLGSREPAPAKSALSGAQKRKGMEARWEAAVRGSS